MPGSPRTHSKLKRGPSRVRSWSAKRCPQRDESGRPRHQVPTRETIPAPGQGPRPSASSGTPRAQPLLGLLCASARKGGARNATPTEDPGPAHTWASRAPNWTQGCYCGECGQAVPDLDFPFLLFSRCKRLPWEPGSRGEAVRAPSAHLARVKFQSGAARGQNLHAPLPTLHFHSAEDAVTSRARVKFR